MTAYGYSATHRSRDCSPRPLQCAGSPGEIYIERAPWAARRARDVARWRRSRSRHANCSRTAAGRAQSCAHPLHARDVWVAAGSRRSLVRGEPRSGGSRATGGDSGGRLGCAPHLRTHTLRRVFRAGLQCGTRPALADRPVAPARARAALGGPRGAVRGAGPGEPALRLSRRHVSGVARVRLGRQAHCRGVRRRNQRLCRART